MSPDNISQRIANGKYSFPTHKAHCSKCGKFIAIYAVNGTDHNLGFVCADCYQVKQKGEKS